jgi:hypothetical protein
LFLTVNHKGENSIDSIIVTAQYAENGIVKNNISGIYKNDRRSQGFRHNKLTRKWSQLGNEHLP